MKLDIPDKEWVFFKTTLGEGHDYVKRYHIDSIRESIDDHETLNNINALVWMPEHCPWIVKE